MRRCGKIPKPGQKTEPNAPSGNRSRGKPSRQNPGQTGLRTETQLLTGRAAPRPHRGDIWFTLFDPAPPALGHEQAEPRPALIVSDNIFNLGPSELVVVLPLTRRSRGNPLHVMIQPPEGGARTTSFILCDQLQTVSHLRLQRHWGRVSAATLREVTVRLRTLLAL